MMLLYNNISIIGNQLTMTRCKKKKIDENSVLEDIFRKGNFHLNTVLIELRLNNRTQQKFTKFVISDKYNIIVESPDVSEIIKFLVSILCSYFLTGKDSLIPLLQF